MGLAPAARDEADPSRNGSAISRTQEITAQLRDEILRGQYRPGERLPSERDLASRFGVNRAITSTALKTLDQLGVVSIAPGGARVEPLERASLDVIGHLLELGDEPDPGLVEQVLEVHRGLTALAVRLGVPRATDEQIERAIELTLRLTGAGLDHAERQRLRLASSQVFVEACDNLVLTLIRRAINLQFMERVQLDEAETQAERATLEPHALELVRCLEARDAEGAALAMTRGMELVHRGWVASLSAGRSAATDESPNRTERT